jgi:hypothetical protein
MITGSAKKIKKKKEDRMPLFFASLPKNEKSVKIMQ